MVKLSKILPLAVILLLTTTCGMNNCKQPSTDVILSERPVSVVKNDVNYAFPKYRIKKTCNQILTRYSYITSYNKMTLTPNWVGWVLTAEHTDGEYGRKGHSFMEDFDVPKPRAIYSDIREGICGFQRGHMCPAGDNKWSFKAQKDAFLMSNICPQNGNLNQHDWKYLEEACREWALRDNVIFIVAGPVFYSDKYFRVGEHGIAVPEAFFKVVLSFGNNGRQPRTIGFLYSNVSGHHKMEYYVRPVDEIERITGLDFFYQLDDSIENVIESEFDFDYWRIE